MPQFSYPYFTALSTSGKHPWWVFPLLPLEGETHGCQDISLLRGEQKLGLVNSYSTTTPFVHSSPKKESMWFFRVLPSPSDIDKVNSLVEQSKAIWTIRPMSQHGAGSGEDTGLMEAVDKRLFLHFLKEAVGKFLISGVQAQRIRTVHEIAVPEIDRLGLYTRIGSTKSSILYWH